MSSRGTTLEEEGFIHASTSAQVSATRKRFYADRNDVLALTIETDLLTSPWQFDRVGDTEFPHVYGPINLDAVVHTRAARTCVKGSEHDSEA